MTEPITEAEQIAQLQQQIQDLVERNRQAEVDRAYWQGRCEQAEKLVPALKAPDATAGVAVAPAAPTPAASFSPDKLLALLPTLLPLLSNPDVLKLLLPVLKSMSTPRPPADG